MTELDELIRLAHKTLRMGPLLNQLTPNETDKIRIHIDAALNDEGWSILHMAVHQYDEPNVAIRDMFAGRLFAYSVAERRKDTLQLIKLIISCGANINLQDKYGRPPIFFAASEMIANLLLSYGAITFFPDLDFSGLHVQCFLRQRYFESFLKDSASALRQDAHGRLPLHWLLIGERTTIDEVTLLIECAAESTQMRDNYALYPLGYAALYSSDEVFSLVLAKSPRFVLETTLRQINEGFIQLDEYDSDTEVDLALTSNILNDIISGIGIIPAVSDFENGQVSKDTPTEALLSSSSLTLSKDDADKFAWPLSEDKYKTPSEYSLMAGGGKGKNKRKKILKSLTEKEEKAPSTIEVDGKIIYLHPDDHGKKHMKHSYLLSKNFIRTWRTGAYRDATFIPKYAETYYKTLEGVIRTRAMQENIAGLVDMGELVGYDGGQETNIIELYYHSEIGSHIRPKLCLSTKDEAGIVPFDPSSAEPASSSAPRSSSR